MLDVADFCLVAFILPQVSHWLPYPVRAGRPRYKPQAPAPCGRDARATSTVSQDRLRGAVTRRYSCQMPYNASTQFPSASYQVGVRAWAQNKHQQQVRFCL
jgi:hypothetical protein